MEVNRAAYIIFLGSNYFLLSLTLVVSSRKGKSLPILINVISAKVEQRDAATFLVLSSHVQLQSEGFLSAWTNSFVGPWDPSQGVHNPDEKIKLWLFLPGKHSAIVEAAQPAVSKLRERTTTSKYTHIVVDRGIEDKAGHRTGLPPGTRYPA
ncbi:hypothetical protein EJ110_NYTH15248 [Nymphaea thermarum]|nr:hypothetical protein EJ110_NYTH15248 [Nymphaea thermarum]